MNISWKRSAACRALSFTVCLAFLCLGTNTIRGAPAGGSVKGMVRATTGAAGTLAVPLPGAKITLSNRDLPTKPLETITDEAGNFAFAELPAATYLLTAEADGLTKVAREIHLTEGASLTVEIDLTASVSESVTVLAEEGLLSTKETSTSNIVRDQTLKNVPLRAENYQSALPLTPGVVRGINGDDNIKGAPAGQNAYTVNGADVTDPVTGKLAFDIPMEAAASVQIEENPYAAEFGRLTGGVTNLETKGGGNKFKIAAARVFPAFRYFLSGPIDSFRPRVTVSGPLVRDRLFFLQSFEYRFTRIRVPNIPAPRDNSTSEAINSFTQLDLTLNKNNRAKVIASFFPQKARYVGLDTFNPQETTPNIKQRGVLFSASEQSIFGDGSFLTSSLSDKTFDIDVFAQGAKPMILAPDGNSGNYFADTRRRTRRLQWQETYYAHTFKGAGQHSLRLGTELDRTNVSTRFRDNPILIQRSNGSLAERIDFAALGAVSFRSGELATFVQDHWIANKKLTLDMGLRLDHDDIARNVNVAPRFSFLFVPSKNNRTVIRGGIGLFFDRTLLSVGYFDAVNGSLRDDEKEPGQPISSSIFSDLPERIVTRFAADGHSIVGGPRRFRDQVLSPLRDPRSIRWSVQVDQGVTKDLTIRLGFLDRTTTGEPIIDPLETGPNTGMLLLSSRGRARYREFQALAVYRDRRLGEWSAFYVWSSARGDLNSANNFLGDLPAFVIRPNQYGPLSFDTPHRFLIYGQIKTFLDINISPSLEIRTGFPYSVVNEQLDFVGARNQGARFPTFISLDAQITKGFRVPMFPKYKMRAGAAIFNLTNHFNPRDVQNNLGSRQFGQFFNGLGTSVRGKFEVDF
ncbi:MAG: hypothetical protein JWM21_3560 [Acidobacteria bacterium]|nr:hypothetical protein [Acidobacteriota bacterium]